MTYVGVQADGKEKTMSNYYASDNGEVTCSSHGGMYFTSEIQRNPKLKTVRTPITTWRKMTMADLAEFEEILEGASPCETCRHHG